MARMLGVLPCGLASALLVIFTVAAARAETVEINPVSKAGGLTNYAEEQVSLSPTSKASDIVFDSGGGGDRAGESAIVVRPQKRGRRQLRDQR